MLRHPVMKRHTVVFARERLKHILSSSGQIVAKQSASNCRVSRDGQLFYEWSMRHNFGNGRHAKYRSRHEFYFSKLHMYDAVDP